VKQRAVNPEEVVEFAAFGGCPVALGPGRGFGGGRREAGSWGGDPRSSYRRRRDELARLRAAAARVADLVHRQRRASPPGLCPELLDAVEVLDAEISRIDAGC
jgi:hypothetical protein